LNDAADVGISVPTLLARRAAVSGMLAALSALLGTASLLKELASLGLAAFVFAGFFAIFALFSTYRAFALRREQIVERHAQALRDLLGEAPSAAIIVAETRCSPALAAALSQKLLGPAQRPDADARAATPPDRQAT
jgi:hypothetical protein